MIPDAPWRPTPATATDETPDLIGITLFRAGVEVRDQVTVNVHGCRHAVSPLSAGFVALCAERLVTDYPVASGALRLDRPVALVGDAASAAAALAAETGSHWLRARKHREVHFLMPLGFVRHRTASIRRRQPDGQPPVGRPHQRVSAVGVGPRLFGTDTAVRAVLSGVEAVVATDWTYANTLGVVPLPQGVIRQVVPYDITDYDLTISGFNATLTELQQVGVRNVALLIEGNPDTLDVLDGICLAGRALHVVPGVPIAVAAAWDVGNGVVPHPFGSGLAYLSGLPRRHEQTQAQFLAELSCYLSSGVACVLVEMTFSDLGIALEAIRLAPTPKTLVLLTDFYSPAARLLVVPAAATNEVRAVIEQGRGRLSTLLVFDDPTGDVSRALR
jgi:hypothetical protein